MSRGSLAKTHQNEPLDSRYVQAFNLAQETLPVAVQEFHQLLQVQVADGIDPRGRRRNCWTSALRSKGYGIPVAQGLLICVAEAMLGISLLLGCTS